MNDKPIRILVDALQLGSNEPGKWYVDLTPAQARQAGATVRGRAGGRPRFANVPRCPCGCGHTLKKALNEHPERIKALSPNSLGPCILCGTQCVPGEYVEAVCPNPDCDALSQS